MSARWFYGLGGGADGSTIVQVNDNLLHSLPAYIPLGIQFTGLFTNPGYTDVNCDGNPRINQLPVSDRRGQVQDFCGYECAVCGGSAYATETCTAADDTVCSPLPQECLLAGQCAGLGLLDAPTGLSPNITALNLTGNVLFAIDVARTLATYPRLQLEAMWV